MSTTTTKPQGATKTPRKATLTERRALWTSQYRKAAEGAEVAQQDRDTAIVNMFRSLPDSVTTKRKTANGETTTTKPVSDLQRAKDTLRALAVGVDDKGTTRDIFALTPVRAVAIVKAYRRAEVAIGASPVNNGSLAPALETPEAATLATALTTAARSNYLGDAGADALAETMKANLFEAGALDSAKPVDVVKAAEKETRDAIAKAQAKKAEEKVAAAAKAKETSTDGPRPVVAISDALDTLEVALTAGAKDLDTSQKAMLLNRLEALALHLK